MIFFWDLMNVVLYDFDVKVLMRIVIVWNIFVVINEVIVDFLLYFSCFNYEVEIEVFDYDCYLMECLQC